jgi:hypothetical protein
MSFIETRELSFVRADSRDVNLVVASVDVASSDRVCAFLGGPRGGTQRSVAGYHGRG